MIDINSSIAEVLEKSADIIQERGLAREQRMDHRGAVCAHGAIAYVVYGNAHGGITDREEAVPSARYDLYKCAYLEVYRRLINKGVRDVSVSGIANWSNRSSADEVCKEFRETAAELRSTELVTC